MICRIERFGAARRLAIDAEAVYLYASALSRALLPQQLQRDAGAPSSWCTSAKSGASWWLGAAPWPEQPRLEIVVAERGQAPSPRRPHASDTYFLPSLGDLQRTADLVIAPRPAVQAQSLIRRMVTLFGAWLAAKSGGA
jgi:hypothetical protein